MAMIVAAAIVAVGTALAVGVVVEVSVCWDEGGEVTLGREVDAGGWVELGVEGEGVGVVSGVEEANVTIAGNTTLPKLAYGLHNLTLYAIDVVGNTGASETLNFTITKSEPPQPRGL